MAKVLGLDLGGGTQQKAVVVAAVAGVLLVVFAVLNRGRGGGTLETGTTADVLRAVELGVTSGAGAATAGLGVGADVANTGADIARSGLSLVDRALGVLGDTTRSLAGEVASVSSRQTDLIGLLAGPAESRGGLITYIEANPFTGGAAPDRAYSAPAPVPVAIPERAATGVPTARTETMAAIDRELRARGVSADQARAMVNLPALARAPGVNWSAADDAAVAAGRQPLYVDASGTVHYR